MESLFEPSMVHAMNNFINGLKWSMNRRGLSWSNDTNKCFFQEAPWYMPVYAMINWNRHNINLFTARKSTTGWHATFDVFELHSMRNATTYTHSKIITTSEVAICYSHFTVLSITSSETSITQYLAEKSGHFFGANNVNIRYTRNKQLRPMLCNRNSFTCRSYVPSADQLSLTFGLGRDDLPYEKKQEVKKMKCHRATLEQQPKQKRW